MDILWSLKILFVIWKKAGQIIVDSVDNEKAEQHKP